MSVAERRALDHVCGPNEIEQCPENLAVVEEEEKHAGDEDGDFSASLSGEHHSDSDISSDDGENVTLSTRGRKRKAKRLDDFLNDEELGEELPLSMRREGRKIVKEEDDDRAERLIMSARRKAAETSVSHAAQDALVREKVKNAFQQGLEMALKELQEHDDTYNASLVSSAVEDALFRLYGGTTKDYKTKMRSLHFNLKDPNNKELRAHVLRGDISPDNFVRMTANELASKELAEYRKRKEEEALKMSVLDAEAAAKFSTAAALEVKGEKTEKKKKPREGPEDETAVDVSLVQKPVALEKNMKENDASHTPVKEMPAEAHANALEEDRQPDTARTSPGLDWASIKSASVQASKIQPNYISGVSQIDTDKEDLDDEPATLIECDENLKKLFLPCPERLALGADKWKGTVSVPGIGNCTMSGSSLSGSGDLEILLGDGLSLKGRLSLTSLDKFLSELHLSKHRTATLGVLKASSDEPSSSADAVTSQTLMSHYKEKDRAGVAKSTSGVEVYLIPESHLASKLLQVAQYLEPDVYQECITKQGIEDNLTGSEIFVAVAVHKKDMVARMKPAPTAPMTALPAGLDLNAISALAEAIGVGQSEPSPQVPMAPPSASLPPNLDLSAISALAQAFGVTENPGSMSSARQVPMAAVKPAPMTSAKPTPMRKAGGAIPPHNVPDSMKN